MKKIGLLLITLCFTLILCSGCTKDGFLNIYKSANEKVGDMVLTSQSKLKGNREFGEDHYTGTYEVTYKKFKGEEVIFGGTTIERDNDNIHIKLNVENSDWNIKIYMKLKEKEESLAIEDGFYEFDFNVKDGSNYLIINGDNYSGKVNIEIK